MNLKGGGVYTWGRKEWYRGLYKNEHSSYGQTKKGRGLIVRDDGYNGEVL